MGEGLEVVKDQIAEEFSPPILHEAYDVDSLSTELCFSSDGRHFLVQVSDEFDRNYYSGRSRVDIRTLGAVLRASKESKVVVRMSGIFHK